MVKNPVNHPARPVYRAIAGLAGLYLVIFGVLGALESSGKEFFAQEDIVVLGQGVNLGASVIYAVFGVIVLIGVGLGRNIDVLINKVFAYLFVALGVATMSVERTDVNYFNVNIYTCLALMVLGLILLGAGMYGQVGTEQEAQEARESVLLP